ncbi:MULTISPECIES: hypothetical protein [Actinomycetes]|uniref:hypothetical protein n=1 Tax=Actinomycetes TaxID=1760 RepID=UPI0001DEEE74|nr:MULTISPECIES: hypothetical protein [Actinomycetes]EFL12715.1 hypothetical protein SSMG_08386 [Streptomyces sp. AA4]
MTRIVLADNCGISIGCYLEDGAKKAFAYMVKAFGEAVIGLVKFLSTFWMKVPSPTVAGQGADGQWHESQTLDWFHGALSAFTGFFAVCAFVFGLGRIAWSAHRSGEAHEAKGLVRQVATVAAGPLCLAAITQLLISAGDAFSPWILERASDGDPSQGMDKLMKIGLGTGAPGTLLGLWLILFLLCLIGSLIQCVFMVIRAPVVIVLLTLSPGFAATTASEEGWQRFKRLGMIVLGFTLYKPVAAIIYAVGIKLMTTTATSQADAPGGSIQDAIYGMVIMVIAALALPAFIKFIAPAAAAGSSSMFSGGAAIGAVAAGAAIVAGAGAGAAGGGASTAGSGATGSGMGGAGLAQTGAGGGSGSPGGSPEPPASAGGGSGSGGGGGGSGPGGGSGTPESRGAQADAAPAPGGATGSSGGSSPAPAAAGSRSTGRGDAIRGGSEVTRRLTDQIGSGEEPDTAEGAEGTQR